MRWTKMLSHVPKDLFDANSFCKQTNLKWGPERQIMDFKNYNKEEEVLISDNILDTPPDLFSLLSPDYLFLSL